MSPATPGVGRQRQWVFVVATVVACGRGEKGRDRLGPALPIASASATPAALTPEQAYRQCFGEEPPPQGPLSPTGRMEAGFQVFAHTCVTCHQPSGRGMPGAFPPLAGSDFLLADKDRTIDIALRGLSGPITVNDRPYAATMPSHGFLTDDDVANVLTYVRSSWGNNGDAVTRDEVAARRAPDAGAVEMARGLRAP